MNFTTSQEATVALLSLHSNLSNYRVCIFTGGNSSIVVTSHFTVIFRTTGYAFYHFTGGNSSIVVTSHFTVIYQTATYLIRTQHFYCISPKGEDCPCQFTSSLRLRLHQRRPLCFLLYCTHTFILTSHTHTHTHTPLGFSSPLS